MSLTMSTVTDDENAEHNRGWHLCTINRLLTLIISSHIQISDFAFRSDYALCRYFTELPILGLTSGKNHWTNHVRA